MDINRYKAFFFDFDGVIVDSLDIKTQAFGELFKKYGRGIIKKVKDYHLKNGGVSRYEKFRYYYNRLLHKPINDETLDLLDKEYSKLVTKKVIDTFYIKGAMEFIGQLAKLGKICFIISATPQKEVKKIVRQKRISRFFKAIAGSPKTKTENLASLLKRYKIKNKDAVYFGDAKSDYEAARINKIDFVGIENKKSAELRHTSGIPKIRDFTIFKKRLV